jgi:hypothetical protein
MPFTVARRERRGVELVVSHRLKQVLENVGRLVPGQEKEEEEEGRRRV